MKRPKLQTGFWDFPLNDRDSTFVSNSGFPFTFLKKVSWIDFQMPQILSRNNSSLYPGATVSTVVRAARHPLKYFRGISLPAAESNPKARLGYRTRGAALTPTVQPSPLWSHRFPELELFGFLGWMKPKTGRALGCGDSVCSFSLWPQPRTWPLRGDRVPGVSEAGALVLETTHTVLRAVSPTIFLFPSSSWNPCGSHQSLLPASCGVRSGYFSFRFPCLSFSVSCHILKIPQVFRLPSLCI